MASAQHKLRVISGQWRGRMLSFKTAPGLRPTSSKTRETLFNWLMADISGARVLDAFAGSGLLGIEALSRGAGHVDFVEKAKPAMMQLRHNLTLLEADPSHYQLLQKDALQYMQSRHESEAYDIVLFDPPFQGPLLERCLTLICEADQLLLKPAAKVYVETANSATIKQIESLPHFNLIKQSRSGEARAFLLQRQP